VVEQLGDGDRRVVGAQQARQVLLDRLAEADPVLGHELASGRPPAGRWG
jgi:hypothetical protein